MHHSMIYSLYVVLTHSNNKEINKMTNHIIIQDEKSEAPKLPAINPMQLMQVAVESNADLDKLEKLMNLQQRWEAGEARKAFFSAMANFQRNCPSIKKLKKGHNYLYAPLGDIMAQIREPLFNCGLSIRFEQDHSHGITVTCIVSHKDGHSERTTMTGGADTSGSKNGIQAIGSTVTYLQRYTVIGALGITTADADIDGRLPQDTSISLNATDEISKLLSSRGQSEADFFTWATRVFKKEVQSFDDLGEEQIQWALKTLKANG